MEPVKLAVFSAKEYDRQFITAANQHRQSEAEKAALQIGQKGHSGPGGHTGGHANGPASSMSPLLPLPVQLIFHDFALNAETVPLARGALAVCVFVNDVLSDEVLTALQGSGVAAVLLRCAGYNNVDLVAAERLGLFVAHVPSYSPQAVAEFAVALLQTLNRQTHRAYNRVREGNFSLDGLLGRTLHGKTVGIVGTGRIGLAAARILHGYGCKLVAYDPCPSADFASGGNAYLPLDKLLACKMKPGALLVNTSRGGLIDTHAIIAALKSRHLGGLALDVYESEGSLFYDDHSGDIIEDDELMRLMTFPNVIVCGHQAFFTEEALAEIAATTLANLDDFLLRRAAPNALVQSGCLVRRESLPVRI